MLSAFIREILLRLRLLTLLQLLFSLLLLLFSQLLFLRLAPAGSGQPEPLPGGQVKLLAGSGCWVCAFDGIIHELGSSVLRVPPVLRECHRDRSGRLKRSGRAKSAEVKRLTEPRLRD